VFFRKKDAIKMRVFKDGNGYMVMASDDTYSVYNCYGSTEKMAKEMALLRLRQA
jgi:hypothetical protein